MPRKNERSEVVRESLNAPTTIDLSHIISIPQKRHMVNADDNKCPHCKKNLNIRTKYKCICCGNEYVTQRKNFAKSNSPIYQSNNGHIEVCNNCRDEYYYQLVKLYNGNEEHAIHHMCCEFGWIFHLDALSAAKQTSDHSRIANYLAIKNLGQTASIGTTYFDSLKYEYENRPQEIIESKEHLEKLKESGNANISIVTTERWGIGIFSNDDYKILDDHYKMLKKQNPNCDSNQEIFIKDLCYTKLQQLKALKNSKSDDFKKFTELYRDTFKQAGLKTVQETDTSNEETLGVTLATISQYTPEEYYKDKKKYKDFDGLGNYIKRFITRPLRNLQHGTTDRDSEYCVKDGDDDE